jgi:hypothetical protein
MMILFTYEVNFKDGKMLAGANVYIEDENVILVNYMRERKNYKKSDIESVVEKRFFMGEIRENILY